MSVKCCILKKLDLKKRTLSMDWDSKQRNRCIEIKFN